MPLDDVCNCAPAAPAFTTDWFSHNADNWSALLQRYKGQPVRALEIGSWEGRSALWLLENVLTHADAEIHCVDHWEGGAEHTPEQVEGTYQRFRANVAPHAGKVHTHFGRSETVLRSMTAVPTYDIIYIDGSHRAQDVLRDAVLAFSVLKVGGVIIFDDYGWGHEKPLVERPFAAINAFVDCFGDELALVMVGYQLAFGRVAPGTPNCWADVYPHGMR